MNLQDLWKKGIGQPSADALVEGGLGIDIQNKVVYSKGSDGTVFGVRSADQTTPVELASYTLSVVENSSATLEISNYQDFIVYEVESLDTNVATVSVTGSTITVNGLNLDLDTDVSMRIRGTVPGMTASVWTDFVVTVTNIPMVMDTTDTVGANDGVLLYSGNTLAEVGNTVTQEVGETDFVKLSDIQSIEAAKAIVPTVDVFGVAPDAMGVDFDGTSDYLSRSNGLIGELSSTTEFTFASWVYIGKPNATPPTVNLLNKDNKINITRDSSRRLNISISNTLGDTGISAVSAINSIPDDTWIFLAISINNTSTATRKVYINDTPLSMSWTTYITTYPLATGQGSGNTIGNTSSAKGRLSNVFLDYTYRDLSIEANRRLFITANGLPAGGLESLNPILYLPMKDASTAHINLGTGGDFVQNGTLATADRGANQDNCVASKFDGVDDYLTTASIGAVDGKVLTISFNSKILESGNNYVFGVTTGSSMRFQVSLNGGNFYNIRGYNSVGTEILNASTSYIPAVSSDHNINIAIDLANVSNRKIYIDGAEDIGVTWTTYTNDNIDFTSSATQIGTALSGVVLYNCEIGELYFDTNYIDLATNNPFWDSETNKPIPVRKAMETLGSNPLICMPIDASNPTKNYGSGGDFTLNGGGLTGARGASEYIARSAKTNSISYLSATSSNIFSDSQKVSMMLVFREDSSGNSKPIKVNNTYFTFTSKNTQFELECRNSSGTRVFMHYEPASILNNEGWNIVLFSLDTTTQSHNTYINGVEITATPFVSPVLNGTVNLTAGTTEIGVTADSTWFTHNSLIYVVNNYIDFSQEANRNLFVNQLGYVRSLDEPIAQGLIPEPLIYLPFDDTSNLGKNLGTGGDFTVNGTVTQGADFTL